LHEQVVAQLSERDPPIAIAEEGPHSLRISIWMIQAPSTAQ